MFKVKPWLADSPATSGTVREDVSLIEVPKCGRIPFHLGDDDIGAVETNSGANGNKSTYSSLYYIAQQFDVPLPHRNLRNNGAFYALDCSLAVLSLDSAVVKPREELLDMR